MEVKCHKCGELYWCELDEEQGLCSYCKTELAVSLPPGSQIKDRNGVAWIRMEDDIDRHLEDSYFNPITGRWKHASRIIYQGACLVPYYKEEVKENG